MDLLQRKIYRQDRCQNTGIQSQCICGLLYGNSRRRKTRHSNRSCLHSEGSKPRPSFRAHHWNRNRQRRPHSRNRRTFFHRNADLLRCDHRWFKHHPEFDQKQMAFRIVLYQLRSHTSLLSDWLPFHFCRQPPESWLKIRFPDTRIFHCFPGKLTILFQLEGTEQICTAQKGPLHRICSRSYNGCNLLYLRYFYGHASSGIRRADVRSRDGYTFHLYRSLLL